MKSVTIAALAALLSTGALAVPTHNALGHGHGLAHANLHRKRDIVWETEYEIETVTVIKTVYGNGVEATGGAYAPSYVTASATTTSAAPVAPTTTKSTTAAAQTTTTTTTTPAVTTTTTPAYVAPTTEAAATTTTTTTTPATTEYVAPSTTLVTRTAAPTTTADVPTTTAEAPTTTTTTAAAATTTAASSSGSGSYSGNGSCESGASYTGDVTYYDPGLGACGITNVATDSIIAVSHVLFDAQPDGGNPNNNPLCGRTVTITAVDGSTHTATVTDRCVGCAEADIDLTQTLFNTVTSNGDGRVHNMKWTWD